MQHTERRVVFFDLDGTLHQQDMFGSFLRYLLRHLPLNLLWATTFGRREAVLKRLEAEFVGWFRHHVTAFPVVHARLTAYLTSTDADVWLITGSPQSLVEQVYRDTLWLPRVNLIASRTARRWGGWVLTLRCLGHEKVVQLEKKIGAPLRLYSGYSDSEQDNPLLGFCQHRWRVTPQGELQQLE